MTIPLTGPGGLFTRAGHYAGGLADVCAWKGNTATARVLSGASLQTRGQTIIADLTNGTPIQSVADGLWAMIAAAQDALSTFELNWITQCSAAIIRQATADAGLLQQDLPTALTEVIRQMKLSSDSLNASTVAIGAQTNSGSPTGTPMFVVSKYRSDGLIWQNVFAETLRVAIIQDAFSASPATARQEVARITGAALIADPFAWNWPGGSGCDQAIALTDAWLDAAGGNMLVNSDWEDTTTANVFDNWTVATGVAGTDIKSTASAYTQSKALQFVGDGSTLSAITQKFETASAAGVGAGGTPSILSGNTQYAYPLWAKCSAVPTNGTVQVALVNGSGTILTDVSGANCAGTVDMHTLGSTSWTPYGILLRTPASLPADYRIRVGLSVALDNAKTISIDDGALTEMRPLYTGGPSIAGFAGATNAIVNDAWTFGATNTRGALAAWLERMFGVAAMNLIFPYSGSPTIADSLVA